MKQLLIKLFMLEFFISSLDLELVPKTPTSRSFRSEASTYGLACSGDGDNHRTCHITVYCFIIKMRRTCGNTQACSFSRLNPGLHIVVTIAEQACDHILRRVLKLFVNIPFANISREI